MVELPEAVLELRNVTKRFGDNIVVDNVSLSIAEHEFITLLGPSGCGKTTTLRMLAGFIQPDSGSIISGTRTLSSSRGVVPPERREMGMVFQNYAVWPHRTVFENVAFGLRLKKYARKDLADRVRRILDLVDLSEMGDRRPDQLSGGQLQRVALARSLVVEPAILLLDEPLSNLDAKLREKMRWEIKEIQRRTQITFVYVTHDQAEAMALSDRIVVMHQGEIQQIGKPREVYTNPRNLMVAEFMGQVNVLPASVISNQDHSELSFMSNHGFHLRSEVPAGAKIGDEVLLAIRPEDVEMRRVGQNSTAPPSSLGRIRESVYLGSLTNYEVAMNGGTTLHVCGSPRSALDVGTVVELSVLAAAIIQNGNGPSGLDP